MPLLRKPFDVPLATDPSARFLALITAVMVYLGALTLAGALIAAELAHRWDRDLAGGLTVEVLPLSQPGAVAIADRAERVLALLRDTPGVVAAEPLSGDQMSHLLEPWLGRDAAHDPVLPIPALIDVRANGTLDIPTLSARLGTVPGVSFDDHGAWLANLRAFTRAIATAAAGIVLLVGGVGVAAVIFAVRAGLAIHHNVVQLLHLMGATDHYVARQFEAHVYGLTARGGAFGLTLAAATLAGLHHLAVPLGAGVAPDLSLGPWQWLVLAMVPVTTIGLAVATTRRTVLRALESMP